jgi:hypothetical protein
MTKSKQLEEKIEFVVAGYKCRVACNQHNLYSIKEFRELLHSIAESAREEERKRILDALPGEKDADKAYDMDDYLLDSGFNEAISQIRKIINN